jgi:hypothetical protein
MKTPNYQSNPKYMTKKEFEQYFREEALPYVVERYEQDGVPDRPARREEWNNRVDSCIQDGILPKSAGDWTHPRWLETLRVPAANSRFPNPRPDIIEGLVALGLTTVGIIGIVMGIRSSRKA